MHIIYYIGLVLIRIFTKLFFRIKIYGKEHVPKEGGFILASNHIAYFDPPILGSWTPRMVYFMGKKELFDNKIFGWLMTQCHTLPVKRGVLDRNAIRVSLDKINKGYGMTIFPEGTRSKTGSFLEPKPGIGLIARQAECDIVPAYISGFNRLKDCFWGKEKLIIRFGEIIPADWVKAQSSDKDGYHAIAQEVMRNIRKTKEIHDQLK